MDKINFAIAELNPKVGDLDGNAKKILDAYWHGCEDGADVVVCPESCLTGYPLEDIVLRESFMAAVEAKIQEIIAAVQTSPEDVVLIFGSPTREDGVIRNSAIVVRPDEDAGKPLVQMVHKYELPNYGVFDEKRHFSAPMVSPKCVEIFEYRVGLMICEDCWFPTVSRELSNDGAVLLLSINGSPFEMGKNVTRRKVIAQRIKETGLPFMYVNAIGGQDELVFDGGSFFYDGDKLEEALPFGKIKGEPGEPRHMLISELSGTEYSTDYPNTYFHFIPKFETRHVIDGEQTAIIRDDGTFARWKDGLPTRITLHNYPIVEASGVASVYQAIVLGVRDYLNKQGFKSVLLGYSGGVDSGIVAAIACDAIGADNVHLVRLPSKFSSDHSLNDAADGAERLGAPMRTIAIEPVVDALRQAYATTQHHEGGDQQRVLTGAADENIQARARGNILMAISNQEGHLLLTTGNKSEVSVGYATLYGDMSGGFNPIKDCYKTMVWALCRWRNGLTPADVEAFGFLGKGDTDVVPEAIIVKPPSAELRADQKDTDSLPPYETLDKILIGFIEREKSSAEIVASGVADEATVTRMRRLVDMAEYKRRQAAPGVKITSKLYGRDRRYPIVNGWRG